MVRLRIAAALLAGLCACAQRPVAALAGRPPSADAVSGPTATETDNLRGLVALITSIVEAQRVHALSFSRPAARLLCVRAGEHRLNCSCRAICEQWT